MRGELVSGGRDVDLKRQLTYVRFFAEARRTVPAGWCPLGEQPAYLCNPMDVPLFATKPAIEPLMPEIRARVHRVLEAGQYILGPEVAAFEEEFASYLGATHAIGVANGTDALTIALRAAGVQPGDEVVVPAVTFIATAEAVVNAGARPVFADVDPETWCMTPTTAEPAISGRTAALLPVHLFGNPAPIAELMDLAAGQARPVRVIEDAAQAAGARVNGRMAGALGHAATFSFYPSKNLGGFGDGGAIVTQDDAIAESARELRFHGSKDKVVHTRVGYNSRLDEIQAAILRVLLPELPQWTAARRQVASSYEELGLGDLVTLPKETEGAECCYHLYTISSPARDEIHEHLKRNGIGSRTYYSPPLHRQPALSSFAPRTELPGATRFVDTTLCLPMGPALESDHIAAVVDEIRMALCPVGVSPT